MATMASEDGDKMATGTKDKISNGADKPEGPPPWFEEYVNARDASMPVRDMPSTEEMEYTLKEEDVGITAYLTPNLKGFEAIIKHRFSDFNVNEINREGSVVRLESLKVPEEKPIVANPDVDAGKWPKHSELAAEEQKAVSSLQWIRVLELAKKTLAQDKTADGDMVTIDITTKEKPERKVIHELIRKTFDHLQTDFAEKEGKKHIAVSKKRKQGLTKAGRPGWPRERPKFLHFTMYKEDQDTANILNSMAKILQKDKKGFGIAGTKDKRARTSQRVSIAFVTPRSIARCMQEVRQWDRKKPKKAKREMVLRAGDFTFEKEGLNLGDLSGNRFTIILRNCISDAEGAMDAALSSLKEKGFVNYFGLQRFGTAAVKTSDVGLAMIKEKWEEAVDLVLKPRANERYQFALCRRIWWQFRDANMAYKVISGAHHHGFNSIEGKVLFGMKNSKPKSCLSALNMIPLMQRLMYLHSYQSLLWNRVVSRRFKEFGTKVLIGDLFIDEAKVEEVHEEKPIAAIPDVDAGTWPKHSELAAEEQKAVSSLQWIRVLQLAKKTLAQDNTADGDTVTIDITTKEKPERKVIHELIQKTFQHLKTEFAEKEGKKICSIAVSKRGKQGLIKAGRPGLPTEDERQGSKDEEETSEENPKGQVSVVTEENMESISIYDVVMPLPGSKVVYPDNGTKHFYQEELEADGLKMDPRTFVNKSDPSYSLGGGYRKIVSKPGDMVWRHMKYSDPNGDLIISDIDRLDGVPEVESDADGAYNGLVVEFNLKSSTYATMALREALKSGTGKVWQTELTAKHLREHRKRTVAETGEDDAAADGEPDAKKVKSVET